MPAESPEDGSRSDEPVAPTPADSEERVARQVALVAAALCNAEWSYPGAWESADRARRHLYRHEALHLIAAIDTLDIPGLRTALDAWTADLHVDAELRAILHNDANGVAPQARNGRRDEP